LEFNCSNWGQLVKFLSFKGVIMSMMKRILMVAMVLLFIGSAFALSTNNIENFALSWNPDTSQLGISIQCKQQALAVLTLSNGMEKSIICPTMDFGATWLIGDQDDSSLTGTIVIPEVCDVCSRTATINLLDNANINSDGNFFNLVIIGILFILVILVIGFFVSKLKR
jgi:hypothetical protein